MLPFGLKIAWFILSLTGLFACWIVLWAFGRAVDARWGPVLYCVGNTMLQGIFCLGMIYKMDPYRMPRSFCIAQTIIISFGGVLIAGVALAFSLATSMTVLKPKTWSDGRSALKWRNLYGIPIVMLPVVATAIHIALIFKFDAVQPADDLHCDTNDPLWIRFLGYAGVPFLLSLPSFYLAVRSIMRVIKTNQHLQRARSDSDDVFTSAPQSRSGSTRKKKFSLTPRSLRSASGSKSATTPHRGPISQDLADPVPLSRRFHLPFGRPSTSTAGGQDKVVRTETVVGDHESSQFSIPAGNSADDLSSRVSGSFPTFAGASAPGIEERNRDGDRVIELSNVNVVTTSESRGSASASEADVVDGNGSVKPDWHGVEVIVHGGAGSVSDLRDEDGEKGWNQDKLHLRSESDIGKEDFILAEGFNGPYSPRPASMGGLPYRKQRRQIPSLAPAVWRIILFQIAFASVQLLSCISTFVDVVKRRPTPTPLGTQHFALLLAAWGPVVFFGHLPAVRRNLIPWHPVKI
ncbi:unnamed protein product [Cyclocybe aegerita]|uniref:Uncharacterized protein n=1 Tax=Cyclocybe aegerita TaxID=1973307 RepID=A0A8S0XQ98_CYCAE|nr:unnamed protein product [Cyclocybe aegerita]